MEAVSVKDFAYNETDSLRYGVKNEQQQKESFNYSRDSIISLPTQFQDGPPWKEDPDLRTPHVDKDHQEYQFSIASSDEIHGKAIALFDFEPENDNEVRLKEGQLIWISYRHGQGWLVAEDDNGETGLVPEEYVELINDDEPKQALPEFMHDNESDWVDEDQEIENEQIEKKLPIKDLKLE